MLTMIRPEAMDGQSGKCSAPERMTFLAQMIRDAAPSHCGNLAECSRNAGLNQNMLNKIVSGGTKQPRLEKLERIARHFGWPLSQVQAWAVRYDDQVPPDYNPVTTPRSRIMAAIHAPGVPIVLRRQIQNVLDTNDAWSEFYADRFARAIDELLREGFLLGQQGATQEDRYRAFGAALIDMVFPTDDTIPWPPDK